MREATRRIIKHCPAAYTTHIKVNETKPFPLETVSIEGVEYIDGNLYSPDKTVLCQLINKSNI